MNTSTETRIDEVAAGIYRISTPVPPAVMPGGFTFNQYLLLDEEPLLFHTGPRRLFPAVREAIQKVMDLSLLRWVAFSHVEADECGSLNEFLAAAPRARPLCGALAAAVSINDLADRPPRPLADGERVVLGSRTVRWLDASHLPHAWECGYLFEETTRTLFCGDLFTQPGDQHEPLVESDILEPSEAFRANMDYYAHGRGDGAAFARVAATEPTTLLCMHGSAWRGQGGRLIRALAERVAGTSEGGGR